MHHENVSHRGRSHAFGPVGLVVAILFGLLATAAVPSTPAGATTGTATYSASVTQPGAMAASFSSTDGWAVAVSSTRVYNVTHHQPTLQVSCHNQIDGSFCWAGVESKTVSDGVHSFAISSGAGVYLNQSTGHLYVFAIETDGNAAHNTAGVACINTTLPAAATGTQLFCGFTALAAPGDAPISIFSTLTAPVLVGSNWYSFNEVAGVGTAAGAGTKNTLLCFNVTTAAACHAHASNTVHLNGVLNTVSGGAPPIGSAGTDVFVPVQATVSATATTELGCFDTVTMATCTGAWPVTINNLAGSPFPMLSISGTATGVCVPIGSVPCFSFAGASVATPANLKHAIGATDPVNGAAAVIGTKVFVPNFNVKSVECFDFATGASCAHFPLALQHLSQLYTVNTDPYRPTCLWVNSDQGADQIQNFDASTGGRCPSGPIRVLASSFVAANPSCQPLSYVSLQVTSPLRSSYVSASVQFASATGTPLALPARSVDGFGVADLTGLNFAAAPLPQFIITLSGAPVLPAVATVHLTWTASDRPDCTTGSQTVTTHPGYWLVASDGGIFNYGNAPFYGSAGNIQLNKRIVGMSLAASHQGYWLVASDGGIFSYGNARFYGSTGNIQLNRPIVGMARTPDAGGYWLVASDGGVFAFGDARFYGSTGNIQLNKPIVGIAANPLGGGYWMVASDGGIFGYGTSTFYGSAGNIPLNKPIVGMSSTFDGKGYWMVASDGGIFGYGDAGFAGSAGGITLNKPIVGMAA